MPLWVKGLKVIEKQNLIFSWSQLKACFNDLDGKILYRYKKLTSYEDYITDVIVSEKYKYFVSSTFSGSVIVWKLQKKKEIIHQFNSHIKCVTSLQEIPNQPTLFISASNDNTIRIFSLDKFTELYSFILPAGVTNINLLSEKIFACFYNDQIKIGKLHHLALSFLSSKIEVKQIQKMFKNEESERLNVSDTIMTLFSDNSVSFQVCDREDAQDISTIFPPPTAKEVVFLSYCMNLDRIFLMLVTGALCVYRMNEARTAILEKMLYPNMIKDESGKVLNQVVTSICFTSVIPPKYDVEMWNEHASSSNNIMEKFHKEQKRKFPEDQTHRFVVMGLAKGTVIFLPIDQIDLIYARFSFHRQPITTIHQIHGTRNFLSICEELTICIWGFKDHRSQVLSLNTMYRPISQVVSRDKNVFIAFKSSDIQAFRFNDDLQDLQFVRTETTQDHDKEITALQCLPEKGLIISGSLDGYVKIFNVKKELIREIKFPEPVFSVSFLNREGDIIVGHLGKVSTVSHRDYQPFEISKLHNLN
jgi:WD40 repeat protein